jgi:hypothetical protein
MSTDRFIKINASFGWVVVRLSDIECLRKRCDEYELQYRTSRGSHFLGITNTVAAQILDVMDNESNRGMIVCE